MARNWAGLTQFGADFGVRKLKMLIFEGENAHGWVFRVERYFAINGLSQREKLMAVALCLEGKTRMWFQWQEQQQPLKLWGEFYKGIEAENPRRATLAKAKRVRGVNGVNTDDCG